MATLRNILILLVMIGCVTKGKIIAHAASGGGSTGGGDGSRTEVYCLGAVTPDEAIVFWHAAPPWPAMGGFPPPQASLYKSVKGQPMEWQEFLNPSRHFINRSMSQRGAVNLGQVVYDSEGNNAFKLSIDLKLRATQEEVNKFWESARSGPPPSTATTIVLKSILNMRSRQLTKQPMLCFFPTTEH